MRLLIETPSYNRIVQIETTNDDLTVEQLIEGLLRPALLGLEYHPDSINQCLGEPKDEVLSEVYEESGCVKKHIKNHA